MRKYLILILVSLVVGSCNRSGSSNSDFEEMLSRINEMEEESMYDQARTLALQGIKEYPEHEFELLKELIYINEKTGEYGRNLEIFDDGHSKGYFFLLHPSLPKCRPYIEIEGFKEVWERDLDLRDSINQISAPDYLVSLPLKYRRNISYPVIFIFHGGGSNIRKAMSNWTSEEIDNNYIRVFLQSSRHSDYNTFGWRNSDSIALEILCKAYSELNKNYSIDSTRIVVSGISAGATSAIYSSFITGIPVSKVLALCTGIPELLNGSDYRNNLNIEVLIIAGENDHYRPRQERLIDSLLKYNINYSYSVLPGMGHEYPPGFGLLLDSILL